MSKKIILLAFIGVFTYLAVAVGVFYIANGEDEEDLADDVVSAIKKILFMSDDEEGEIETITIETEHGLFYLNKHAASGFSVPENKYLLSIDIVLANSTQQVENQGMTVQLVRTITDGEDIAEEDILATNDTIDLDIDSYLYSFHDEFTGYTTFVVYNIVLRDINENMIELEADETYYIVVSFDDVPKTLWAGGLQDPDDDTDVFWYQTDHFVHKPTVDMAFNITVQEVV